VRAYGDINYQRIQQITRLLPGQLTEEVLQEFRQLISQCCTFVNDWDDPLITLNAIYVFGKKAAVYAAREKLITKITNDDSIHFLVRKCVDEESRLESSGWHQASASTTKKLNYELKEPDVLYFFAGATFEITFNKDGSFSNSQLAYLCEEQMPTQQQLDSFASLKLMVAPEGCKTVPENCTTKQSLEAHGWREKSIGVAPQRTQKVPHSSNLFGQRKQYGLQPRVSSTIHAIMGQTLAKLVTRIMRGSGTYALWLREQIVVLLSRTRRAQDIIFVGTPSQTIDALIDILQQRSQYTMYMAHILEQLAHHDHTPPRIDLSHNPYRTIDFALPVDTNAGYSYLLISTRDSSQTYIGQTINLHKRFQIHNRPCYKGTRQTGTIDLQPWAIFAFVCGFNGDQYFLLQFEKMWQNVVRRMPAATRTPGRIANELDSIVDRFRTTHDCHHLPLKIVRCMRMVVPNGQQNNNNNNNGDDENVGDDDNNSGIGVEESKEDPDDDDSDHHFAP